MRSRGICSSFCCQHVDTPWSPLPDGFFPCCDVTVNFYSITAMPQYITKSFEELRCEDYAANVKNGQSAPPPAAPTGFGAGAGTTSTPTGFGFGAAQSSAPAFGAASTGSVFGQANRDGAPASPSTVLVLAAPNTGALLCAGPNPKQPVANWGKFNDIGLFLGDGGGSKVGSGEWAGCGFTSTPAALLSLLLLAAPAVGAAKV